MNIIKDREAFNGLFISEAEREDIIDSCRMLNRVNKEAGVKCKWSIVVIKRTAFLLPEFESPA